MHTHAHALVRHGHSFFVHDGKNHRLSALESDRFGRHTVDLCRQCDKIGTWVQEAARTRTKAWKPTRNLLVSTLRWMHAKWCHALVAGTKMFRQVLGICGQYGTWKTHRLQMLLGPSGSFREVSSVKVKLCGHPGQSSCPGLGKSKKPHVKGLHLPTHSHHPISNVISKS